MTRRRILTTRQRLLFIVVFGPAMLAYPLGFVFTAFRIAWVSGSEDAVKMLAEKLAEDKLN